MLNLCPLQSYKIDCDNKWSVSRRTGYSVTRLEVRSSGMSHRGQLPPHRINSCRIRAEKQTFCICENKDADQLRGNREADPRLCFRFSDSTIPLLSKSKISSFSSHLLCLHRLGCVIHVWKPYCWFSHEVAQISTVLEQCHQEI